RPGPRGARSRPILGGSGMLPDSPRANAPEIPQSTPRSPPLVPASVAARPVRSRMAGAATHHGLVTAREGGLLAVSQRALGPSISPAARGTQPSHSPQPARPTAAASARALTPGSDLGSPSPRPGGRVKSNGSRPERVLTRR